MRIAIIGSTQYLSRFMEHKASLEANGHEVHIPALDHCPALDELGVCFKNKEMIKWADEIHMIWDRRSTGTIFDFGMVFMAGKPLRIIYLEPKTFEDVMKKYECLFSWEASNV